MSMWTGFRDFWRRLFGWHPDNPNPGPTPDPTPDPEPTPTPAPVYTNLFPDSVILFCEAATSDRYDNVNLSSVPALEAQVADKFDACDLNSSTLVCGIRGKSRKVRTIRLIHPWYDPFKTSPTDAVMLSWFKEAKSSGCVAMAVDWEGYLKSLYETERLARIAASVGLPLILVPKWTLDPSGEYYCGCKSQAEVVAILNRLKIPAVLPWLYMGDATWRRVTIKSVYRDNGYTGQIIGMTDGGMREGQTDSRGNRYNTVAETWEFMQKQRADRESIGLFNIPPEHKSLSFAMGLYKKGLVAETYRKTLFFLLGR